MVKKSRLDSFGYCRTCGVTHTLPSDGARKKSAGLIRVLEEQKSIGFLNGANQNPLLSTTPLFEEPRGKMFGVLECLDHTGATVWLYAFSGQFNGQCNVEGWAPSIFDLNRFGAVHDPGERRIKALGRRLAQTTGGSEKYADLIRQRKQLSRRLMTDIHELYQLQNCAGEQATLHQACILNGGKPTGMGDCCAPKLLNWAAVRNLLPLSLAEFYFGKTNRSNSKIHGTFYAPCKEKCQPLLGFLLCGIEQRKQNFVN